MIKLNESIRLDPIEVELFDSNKNEIAKTDGQIDIAFQPRFRAIIKGEFKNQGFKNFRKVTDIKYIKVDSKKELIRVTPLNISISGSVKFTLSPASASFFIGSDTKVTEVKFYITNFDPMLKHQVLAIGDWKLDLKFISEVDEFKKLKSLGGYLVTHEGTISLADESPFKKKDLEDLMVYLFLLFTFTNGFDTCPFYLRGVDNKGKLKWYQVSNNKVDRFQKTSNWFELPYTDLESFNTGFYSLFNHELYNQYLREIIYWYVHSNKDGIDKSVILSHTCLELISWVFLTLDKQNLSKDGFNNLYAADSFSLTLTSCSIPINIPSKLQNLTKLAKGDSNINNACQAYSLVRNKIIHPSSKRRKEITKSEHVFEAKLLGCKFIELFVLYQSNYQGSYFNRVNYDAWKGTVETVPWA